MPTAVQTWSRRLFGTLLVFLFLMLLAWPGARALAQTVIATIPVGTNPFGVGVNPTTNRIYVANDSSNSVSVIDGGTNTVSTTVAVGPAPIGVGVNPVTNRIYVANRRRQTISSTAMARRLVITMGDLDQEDA